MTQKFNRLSHPDKLKLKLEEVEFMGHILTGKGIKIDPDKMKAIVEMPAPTIVEEVQRLNDFVNYQACLDHETHPTVNQKGKCNMGMVPTTTASLRGSKIALH